MNYNYAIKQALEAAKIKTEHFEKEKKLRYLEEACDWIQVAHVYFEQLKQCVTVDS